MSNFSVLENVERTFEFRGEQLKVSPLKVGQIPKFARAIRPCFAALAGLIGSAPSAIVAGGGGEPEVQIDPQGVIDLIADHGEKIIEATAIAVGVKQELIEGMNAAELVSLVCLVFEVNADFFSQAVAKLSEENSRRASGAGLTPSSS